MSSTSPTSPDQYASPCWSPAWRARRAVLAQGGVEDRDALGQRQGQVEEQRALPRLPDRLGPQFGGGRGRRFRRGGEQLPEKVGRFAATTPRPAKPAATSGLGHGE